MDSHTLADLLKSRRTNDMRFEVEVIPPGSDEDGRIYRVEMHDDRMKAMAPNESVALEEVLRYNPDDDVLLLRLGAIYLGRTGDVAIPEQDARFIARILRWVVTLPESSFVPLTVSTAKDRIGRIISEIEAASK
jgi:hypothetical protein